MKRPPMLVAACGMLAAAGVLFAGEVLLSGDKYFTDMRTYEQAAAGGVIPNESAFAAVGVVIHLAMTAIGVLAGFALVLMAVFAFFGKAWARVVSWIFGLPILLWYGVLAALSFVGSALNGDPLPDTDPELARRFEQAWPSWLDTLDTALMAAVAILLIGALVAQTVPATDAYFRQDAYTSIS